MELGWTLTVEIAMVLPVADATSECKLVKRERNRSGGICRKPTQGFYTIFARWKQGSLWLPDFYACSACVVVDTLGVCIGGVGRELLRLSGAVPFDSRSISCV